jgi:hypothetical protein
MLAGFGCSLHWFTVPKLFIGDDAVLFTIGISLVFHAFLLRFTKENQVFQKGIDYIWYCGAAFGLTLYALSALSDSELELRQTELNNYMAIREEALADLTALVAHNKDPSLTYKPSIMYEDVKPAPEIRPSDHLSVLAEREMWRWIRDEPILNYGIDLYQLKPKFSQDAWLNAKAQSFLTEMTLHIQNGPIPDQSQEFCELAEEEWDKSEWGRVYAETNKRFNEWALPSSKQPFPPIKQGGITYEGKIVGINPLPHRFGTAVCIAYAKLATLVKDRNERQSAPPPNWLAKLKPHWMMILGGIIGFRLVKTTAEVLNAYKGRKMPTTRSA